MTVTGSPRSNSYEGAVTTARWPYAPSISSNSTGDLRSTPLEDRKRTLTRLIGKPPPGIMLNATFEEPGDIVFKHACALGCEGIVSKRLGSRYRSGHSRDWIKSKNPAAPAVKREAEEDWRKGR
jgi:bifunctional non-homologous end joining protein LigD